MSVHPLCWFSKLRVTTCSSIYLLLLSPVVRRLSTLLLTVPMIFIKSTQVTRLILAVIQGLQGHIAHRSRFGQPEVQSQG
ncbi:hypothetical protein NEOLEDRAFT_1126802 [Neolentinus lepideus HHB14362 ss-1]|uniref:Uncharacterized protein n=1 Tax=Neolentinus lepideus HHB14362 ss-1 TaxID=1314782 RepID=A0A165VQP2_9AGAM|nr:hypothetical protein NEOLEDRAFT_1126802 [Neolentinus lepideus HHB14362 ss-1]